VADRELTGVLLVGGASRRFGSPKALASFRGATLAERGWSTLGEVCDERIAVGKATDGLELPFPTLHDGSDIRTPAAGIVAGLRAAAHDLAVFLPVDSPLVTPEVLRALAAACEEAARAQTGPLPAALRTTTLPVWEGILASESSLRAGFERLQTSIVPLDPSLLANVNTPADLETLDGPEIDLFEKGDAEGFRSLVLDTLVEFGFSEDPDHDADLVDPASAYDAVWVARAAGDVVGSIAVRLTAPGELELRRMYLRVPYRGRGLGHRLLELALSWARAHGAAAITLDTTEEMVAARRLYERAGFARVGPAPGRQGRPRILYRLDLR
jgi:molybdopterin-guanine dinucleotide biosynthesis protein A/RimJ/RimL family protein N-acetyltransferase